MNIYKETMPFMDKILDVLFIEFSKSVLIIINDDKFNFENISFVLNT